MHLPQLSLLFIIGSLLAIMNYEGLVYDIMGASLEAEEDVEKETDVSIGGTTVGQILNKRQEFPYDWNVGHIVYIAFLSAVFMGKFVCCFIILCVNAQPYVSHSAMVTSHPCHRHDHFGGSGHFSHGKGNSSKAKPLGL